MPEFADGENLVIKIGTAADNTLVDRSDYIKGIDTDETVDNEDITTVGTVTDGAKILAYLLNGQSFDLAVQWDADFWAEVGKLGRQKKKVAFWVYPQGEGDNSNELWICNVLLSNRKRGIKVNETSKGSVTVQRTGTIQEGTIASLD